MFFLALIVAGCATARAQGQPAPAAGPDEAGSQEVFPVATDIIVTASHRDLLGMATTVSQGSLTQLEVELPKPNIILATQ